MNTSQSYLEGTMVHRSGERKAMVTWMMWTTIVFVAWAFAACGAAQQDGGPPTLAIIGTYTESTSSCGTITHAVTATTWTDTEGLSVCGGPYTYALGTFSDSIEYVVGNETDGSSTGWSRFDWTNYQGNLYYCTSAFGLATEAEAIAAARAPDTNPTASTACGGFAPWSLLTPVN